MQWRLASGSGHSHELEKTDERCGETHPDMKRFGGPEAGMLQLGVVCRDARFAEFKLTPVMRK